MTVRELIAKLNEFPKDSEVYVWDTANSVHMTTDITVDEDDSGDVIIEGLM